MCLLNMFMLLKEMKIFDLRLSCADLDGPKFYMVKFTY